MLGEKGYLCKFEKYIKFLMKMLMLKGYELNVEKIEYFKVEMQWLIEVLNEKLIVNYGCYFVGDCLGLVDIVVCLMLVFVLEIKGIFWEKDYEEGLFEEFSVYKIYLINLFLGQYVLRVY